MIRVVGSRVDATSYPLVTEHVMDWSAGNESRYICVANVHMLMVAYDSAAFRAVVEGADLVVPDGVPLSWVLRLKGVRRQQRVYGPALMLNILEAAAREGTPVGLYGGEPDVLDRLTRRIRARFEGLRIVYSLGPPYRELSSAEDARVVEQINRSGARILFVGLGCPKQETWMAGHRGSVNAVMLGVGAAFDFHAGAKAQAPAWMQQAGLEWLFRLFTEPRRLWSRYLYHNPRFLALAAADILGLLKRTA